MDKQQKTSSASDMRSRMLRDRKYRLAVVRQSHYWFFHFYFWHYVKFRTAEFQRQMFKMTEDMSLRLIAITAFRGSGKSTIMNMAFVLWAILGVRQKKFILIVGQTQAQARQHLRNIKEELEHNKMLHNDLGPFREEEDEWRNSCLVIRNHGAKIMAVSIDQAVRGLRHGQYRPDLIICDDIEDLDSVKTLEGRDKTYRWVKGELLPAGDINTTTVFIGNLLHEDCLLKRLQREVESGTLEGVYREYPLLDREERCLWPGKYPNVTAIEAECRRIGSPSAWYREYLLQILPDHERLIHRDWITYYGSLPLEEDDCFLRCVATGIDLAISQNDSADNTAMVSGLVYGRGDDMRIYILPNPVNERLTFLETIDRAKDTAAAVSKNGHKTALHVEDVGYQHALIEELERDGMYVIGVPPKGQDKRARLALITHLIQGGRVLFPRIGCDVLVTQLVGFGSERYDDLADALAILLLPMLELQGHRTSFSLAELNRPSTFEEDRAEERRHSGFYYPDHSDDRVSGGHEDILSMQW